MTPLEEAREKLAHLTWDDELTEDERRRRIAEQEAIVAELERREAGHPPRSKRDIIP